MSSRIRLGAYRDVARRLDLHANASGRRRALPTDETAGDDLDIDAIGLIADEYYRTLHGAPNRGRDDNHSDDEDGAGAGVADEDAETWLIGQPGKDAGEAGVVVGVVVEGGSAGVARERAVVAHTRDQAFLDDSVVATAIADLSHELPTNPDTLKPRTQTGTRSRR